MTKTKKKLRARQWFMVMVTKTGCALGLNKHVAEHGANCIFSPKMKRKAFAGYQPTHHDVFAATYTKSGTNWAIQIAQQIAHLGEAEFNHIHQVVPWPDWPFPLSIPLSDTTSQDTSPTGKRIIKTHLETEYVPYSKEAVYLVVIRDPKEVIVSHYYFSMGIPNLFRKIHPDDWLEMCLSPKFRGSFWAEHTAGFWEWRDRPNVLVLMFSEMKADLPGAIRRIAELMDVSLTEDQFNKVLERSGFQYMKRHESQFSPLASLMMKGDNIKMIRSGKAGGSGELLSKAQQARIDRFHQAELRRLGSDFPYAEYFEIVEI
ncbi:MAG: sulfotransferase domain-containing protein [Desulfobacterales bacterium]|nr:sulfotransferase domain-containing protein [Desulfobacterales bacterium]